MIKVDSDKVGSWGDSGGLEISFSIQSTAIGSGSVVVPQTPPGQISLHPFSSLWCPPSHRVIPSLPLRDSLERRSHQYRQFRKEALTLSQSLPANCHLIWERKCILKLFFFYRELFPRRVIAPSSTQPPDRKPGIQKMEADKTFL
jgi:hypothetical protein